MPYFSNVKRRSFPGPTWSPPDPSRVTWSLCGVRVLLPFYHSSWFADLVWGERAQNWKGAQAFAAQDCSWFIIIIFYWSIADSQCCHSFRGTAKGLSHVYTCIHSPPNSPLVHKTLSRVYGMVGPCWLSILNIAVCTCPSQTH